jgi:hypothetical protein
MIIGVVAWGADVMMDEAALAEMSAAQQQLYASRPQWLIIVYAIAVFTGLLGSIGLLLRKRWSVTAFVVSLCAIVVQFGYTLTALNAIDLLGPATALPFPIMIFTIGLLLLGLSVRAQKAGWLS